MQLQRDPKNQRDPNSLTGVAYHFGFDHLKSMKQKTARETFEELEIQIRNEKYRTGMNISLLECVLKNIFLTCAV